MAGYSGTPLAKKLGIQENHRVLLIRPPQEFEQLLEPVPEGVRFLRQARAPLDVVVLFCRWARDLRRLPELAEKLAQAGGLWVAWPKKASKVETDLAFDVVQAAGLELGLVDNKVCAIDETYSGLRFVIRMENRR